MGVIEGVMAMSDKTILEVDNEMGPSYRHKLRPSASHHREMSLANRHVVQPLHTLELGASILPAYLGSGD